MTREEIEAAVELARFIVDPTTEIGDGIDLPIARALLTLHAEAERWRPVVEAACEWAVRAKVMQTEDEAKARRLKLWTAIDTARQGAAR